MARIFILDRAETAELLAFALDCEGHEVITENQPAQAFREIILFQPDLVLAEYSELDGGWLCRQMKTLKCTRDIPFVMMSYTHPDVKLEGFIDMFHDLGARHFLLKPFNTKQVAREVQKWL